MSNIRKGRTAGRKGPLSAAMHRIARVALGVTQRHAAEASKVGWRSMQRIELGEEVTESVHRRIRRYWERQGIQFLADDPRGWGIRVPKAQDGPVPGEALKALRVGLDMTVEQAAGLAGVTDRSVNRLEGGKSVSPAVRESVAGAYADLGVAFLRPTEDAGWGFLIPEDVSPQTAVILIRPRRKGEAKVPPSPQSRSRRKVAEPAS